ncbi:MAG: ATP-binding cassette domain-containing protein, partial [Planctomycetota bacterium]
MPESLILKTFGRKIRHYNLQFDFDFGGPNSFDRSKRAFMTDENLAIQANELCKTYTDGLIFRKKFNALKSVSFDVKKGEAFGLLGPNGAGKTTFIKILLGIIRKSRGEASMLGFPAGSQDGRRL